MDDSSSDQRTRGLDAAHRAAAAFLASVDERPVWPRAGLEEMLTAFGGPLPESGSDAAEVVAEMAERADPGLVAIPGGRFFGFVIGATHPAALAADWLVSAWDQNSGSSTLTPATVAMERVAGQWMLDLLGLPEAASVGFVTGGQMANFTCLATARTAVLAREGWDATERGTRLAPPVRIVVGADRHASIDRALRFLGVGRSELEVVASDDQGRMTADALAEVLTQATGPLVVCLQAGEVHTGAFDDFAALIPIAHEHGAWVHVDGAFGLWAAASAAAGLASVEGITIVNDVDYTQVMFRRDDDDATRALGEAILAEGTAAVTGAVWRGRATLRCSMSSWATTAADVGRTVDAIRMLVAAG